MINARKQIRTLSVGSALEVLSNLFQFLLHTHSILHLPVQCVLPQLLSNII